MLPDNIGFGRVRMRVLLGVPDSPDDDDEFPEARGASGSVKFVPAVTRVVNISGAEPVTIGLPVVEGTLNAEGYLCGPDGVPGVYLIATDDTDNQPVNWTYKVQFNITGVAIPNIDIHVPEGSDTDLTLITPVPSSPGVGQNQWEALVLRAEQAALAAEDAVFSIEVNGVVYTPDETGKVTLVIEGGGGGAELTSYVEQVASLADYPAAFPAEDHEHEIADVNGLQTALDGKAQSGHNHIIAQVSGLQDALDAKSNTGHGHAIGDVSGLQTALDGKQPAGNYATAVHGHAIEDVSGLQAALDGKVPTTRTVAGKPLSADVTLAKDDVGLGNVDNTSDADKPVSTAQAVALAEKATVIGLGGVTVSRRTVIVKDEADYAGQGQAGDVVLVIPDLP